MTLNFLIIQITHVVCMLDAKLGYMKIHLE